MNLLKVKKEMIAIKQKQLDSISANEVKLAKKNRRANKQMLQHLSDITHKKNEISKLDVESIH